MIPNFFQLLANQTLYTSPKSFQLFTKQKKWKGKKSKKENEIGTSIIQMLRFFVFQINWLIFLHFLIFEKTFSSVYKKRITEVEIWYRR